MSSATLSALCGSALAIGVFHTLLGPDHYLPFVALSKARAWSRRRTLLVTAGFGLAHTLGTVLLGAAGLALGLQLGWLESIEALRGDLAALGLLGLGLAYTGWATWRLLRHRHTRHHTPTYTHIHEGAPGHSHEAGAAGALHFHGFHRHPHAHRHDLPAPVLSWACFWCSCSVLAKRLSPCSCIRPPTTTPWA